MKVVVAVDLVVADEIEAVANTFCFDLHCARVIHP